MSTKPEDQKETIFILIIRIGQENFGVKASIIQEVVPIMSIQKFPDMPDFLEGFIDIRGSLYAVVDVSKQLGKKREHYYSANRIILMKFQGRNIGFIVDEIERMEDWHAGIYQQGMLVDISAKLNSGEIGQTAAGNIPVLNLSQMLSKEKISMLSTRESIL